MCVIIMISNTDAPVEEGGPMVGASIYSGPSSGNNLGEIA